MMKLKLWLKEKLYRHRSKQTRQGPAHATRGRIYAMHDEPMVPGDINARALPKASMKLKIMRTDGTVEFRDVEDVSVMNATNN